MTAGTSSPWLKIEHTGQRYQVHWRVERRHGPTTLVDLGNSQSFATESEAQRWCTVFARALGGDEPLLPPGP